MSSTRIYGSSVLMPIQVVAGVQDLIMAVGGNDGLQGILDTMQICDAAATPPLLSWSDPNVMPLTHKRWLHNTVLLPDTKILVVGGEKKYYEVNCSEEPAYVPELYEAGNWTQLAQGTIIRDYHGCALLLPDGSVFTCGGESRHVLPRACPDGPLQGLGTAADYQIFKPPYLTSGNTVPTILNKPGQGLYWTWPYGTQQELESKSLPVGVSISKITLMRGGSVTHHADPNQRCVELNWQVVGETPQAQNIQMDVPTRTVNLLPRGFYMLFLVTNQGTPSQAAWVKIQ